MVFFVKRFRFKGSAPHGPLEGSRIVKRGATWWFEGEPRPGRKPPKRKDPTWFQIPKSRLTVDSAPPACQG
jgi:hypothetical protein